MPLFRQTPNVATQTILTRHRGAIAAGVTARVRTLPQIPAEPIVLQALVTREGDAVDGVIIHTLEPAWCALAEIFRRDPEALLALSSRQFEELLAATYDKAGYDEVILTPGSGDGGRDVIATKRGWGSVRIIDQAKRYKPGHKVTANEVRALLGVLSSDRNASKGIVTTTSTFAPRIAEDPSIAPFMPHRLELVAGDALAARLEELFAKSNPEDTTRTQT